MTNRAEHSQSPFHAGERWVQDRYGVRTKVDSYARRAVRDHLPDQHREFYPLLPFVLLGTVDAQGRPWASLVAGRPGFVTSPDARTLEIAVRPLFGDPLHQTLVPGADIGLLGIELETRRRNRLAGRIAAVRPDGFTIAVAQAFGNCPQYIQTRAVEVLPWAGSEAPERPVHRAERFDRSARALIEGADTLFIATAFSDGRDAPSNGADVSHRGGRPGFVRLEDDRTFVFPDFSGNNHFNTIGNIVLDPRAGVLFVDFEAGDLLYATGDAEIVWDGAEVRRFAGAERLVRFRAEDVIRVAGSLPLRFRFGAYAPQLARTGSWAEAEEALAAARQRTVYVAHEVKDVVR